MMSVNSGPNCGTLETAQQTKGIPEGDPPGYFPGHSGILAFPLLGHFYCMGGQILL
jgi:hypothetical protein